MYTVVLSHQEMQGFLNKGFRNHESIFPIINFHLFQTSASNATLTKFMSDIKNGLKKVDTPCNQIDALEAKLSKLNQVPGDKDNPGKQRGKPFGGGPPEGFSSLLTIHPSGYSS
jgi:hypothetical protein